MAMQVDIGVPVSAPVADQVEYIRRAEELGFAGVGLGDNLSAGHDIFVTMALAAAQTSRITLYPAAANPVTRHPAVLANLARSLAEQAPGRVKLAIGRGGRELVANGLKPAGLSQLRDALALIRNCFREWNDDLAPPLMLGASGPRTLELAGEVADEVLLQVGPDPQARAEALDRVREGAVRAGRSRQGLPITDYVLVSVEDDREAALRRALPWLRYMVGAGTFQLALAAHGLSPDDLGSQEALLSDLPQQLADILLIAGTPDEVARRFERVADSGVQRVCCMVPGGPKVHRRTLEALAQRVLPAVR